MAFSGLLVLLGNHFRVDFGLFSLIAIAMSFGKISRSTKAWRIVVTSSDITTSVAMAERTTDRDLVTMLGTSLQYSMVAMAAAVIGKL